MNDIVIIIATLLAVFFLIIIVLLYIDYKFTLFVQDFYKEFNSRFPESFNLDEAAVFNDAMLLYTSENDLRYGALQNAVKTLNDQLDELIKLQSARQDITWDSVRESFNECATGLESARNGLLMAGNALEDSVNNYVKELNRSNYDVNLINKLLSLIQELNNNFTNYKSRELDTALEHLKKISDTLEISIGSTYTSVQEMIETSTGNLKTSYEQFYTACKKLNDYLDTNFIKREFSDFNKEEYKDAKYILGTFNNKISDVEYTIDGIQSLILNRSIRSRDYTICKAGTNDWQPITSVRSLKNTFDTVEGNT